MAPTPSFEAYFIPAVDPASGSDLTSVSQRTLNPTKQDLGIKIATPAGVLVGQLLFGWLGDVLGRKRICTSIRCLSSNSLYSLVWLDGMELMVIMVATFGQTM